MDFVICDDNLSFLKGLELALNKIFIKHDFDGKITFKSTNPEDTLNYLKNNKADVIFLDIKFNSDMNGIELAKKIRETNKNAYIIFTTTYLEYTFLAFHVKTFDYLRKPISTDRLESTLNRLFDDISNSNNTFIPINKKTYIKEDEIYYIKRDGMKLVFKTHSKNYEVYSSFNKLSSCLPSNFIRCHKSYIANLNNISSVDITTNTIIFNDDSECYIGPKYKSSFIEVINNETLKN